MRAILVCVDYADLLTITLPHNRHHFDDVLVVTHPSDAATLEVARRNDARAFQTEAFYQGGAHFNKWKALEEGLDKFGRWGWLCLMDADILWPRAIPGRSDWLKDGCLHTPRRRMLRDVTTLLDPAGSPRVPDERDWRRFPLHPRPREFVGYTQIFHADDPVVGSGPWHETDWRHAGGADTFFQAQWPAERKVRPPFQVLHLGPAGTNWCGRASPYTDGRTHADSEARRTSLLRFRRGRKKGPRRHDSEKIS